MNKEKRAVANNEEVGQLRYDTYRKSISRIKSSIDAGYYLEAITLCESLIADRLESRLNFLTKSDAFSFKNLGKLQEGIITHDTVDGLKRMMIYKKGDLDLWRDSRNKALHRMAKIEEGDSKEWENKIAECMKIAHDGEELRKEIFKLTRRN